MELVLRQKYLLTYFCHYVKVYKEMYFIFFTYISSYMFKKATVNCQSSEKTLREILG
jgi:hypothetical protein